METFLEAATGLPTLPLTAALVVVGVFWLLAALRLTTVDAFDADADLRAWGLDGVPVAVAFSLLTVVAWGVSVGAAALLAHLVPTGAPAGALRLVTTAGALLVAWRTTRRMVRLTDRHRRAPRRRPGRSASPPRPTDGPTGARPHPRRAA
ncbi:hypothetical protein [Streptomyces sp. NPDC006997]|uniref:hypothetical protein n=1 Tax=Streptomyces sp. NPDC006997 TaxID=3155356 RepID=UPI0033ECB232